MIIKRILIVDDTRTWLFFHKEIIRQLYGETFEVTVCTSAAKAMSLINKNMANPYNIIITDLQMENDYEPKTAGEWLIENTKRLNAYSTSSIIIISGMYNIEYIANTLNVECISKQRLVNNKLLIKYMFEKIMPHLKEIQFD